MTREEAYALMTRNPTFHLATIDGDTPRVRGMMLYSAGPEGILFHSGVMKDVHKQIAANPRVEMCFFDPAARTQLRVNGTLEIVDDNNLKTEIANHPTRIFLKAWMESGELKDFFNTFAVYRMRSGKAFSWTMEKNFAPKEYIDL